MSAWKKAMFYLGLGPEDEMENAPPPMGLNPEEGMAPPAEGSFGPTGAKMQVAPVLSSAPEQQQGEPSAVRALGPMDSAPEPSGLSAVGSNATTAAAAARSAQSASRINTVRPLPASSGSSSKPHIVAPRAFNDAQEVADRFKAGSPVIMNLQSVERDLSRRLIDFASGMCYGLGGQMEKVGDRVYLLSPDDVELSPEDRRELHEQGLHNG